VRGRASPEQCPSGAKIPFPDFQRFLGFRSKIPKDFHVFERTHAADSAPVSRVLIRVAGSDQREGPETSQIRGSRVIEPGNNSILKQVAGKRARRFFVAKSHLRKSAKSVDQPSVVCGSVFHPLSSSRTPPTHVCASRLKKVRISTNEKSRLFDGLCLPISFPCHSASCACESCFPVCRMRWAGSHSHSRTRLVTSFWRTSPSGTRPPCIAAD